MARIIRREGRSRKFDLLKPSVKKRVPDESRIDHRTGKPWMKMIYKPVKCLKKVPLKQMPQDILRNMKWWFVDGETSEAVMEDQDDKEILRVYDPLHLVNLSRDDLLKLHANQILCHDSWMHEGRKYQKVVKVCVTHGLHAGSVLNRE